MSANLNKDNIISTSEDELERARAEFMAQEEEDQQHQLLNRYVFVILARGIVICGKLVGHEGLFLQLENAVTLRHWGTQRGLGELCKGPNEDTAIDPTYKTIGANFHALVEMYYDLDQEVWDKVCRETNANPPADDEE